jgi:PadR family transcriptional regulator AphA
LWSIGGVIRPQTVRYRSLLMDASTAPPGLACGEWAILGLITEQHRHGFALARLMAPGGEVGQVWALPKPLVYRALATLQDRGLAAPAGEERGERGPNRVLLGATPEGVAALQTWLTLPVRHLRDVRSLLMLKLALLDRVGGDPVPLLSAQRERLLPLVDALAERLATAEGFGRTLLAWRLESARAAVRFVEAVGDAVPVG